MKERLSKVRSELSLKNLYKLLFVLSLIAGAAMVGKTAKDIETRNVDNMGLDETLSSLVVIGAMGSLAAIWESEGKLR